MTHTLEKNQALDTHSNNGNMIVPFKLAQTDRATQIRQHLENTTSLHVLLIAQDYLRLQQYPKPIRMVPTSSGPRSKPIHPKY